MAGVAAKNVIDIAYWDVLGRSVGLSTYVILSGKLIKESPAFSIIRFRDIEVAVSKTKEEHEKVVAAMQLEVANTACRCSASESCEGVSPGELAYVRRRECQLVSRLCSDISSGSRVGYNCSIGAAVLLAGGRRASG